MRHFDHVIFGSGQALGTLLGDLIPTGDSIAVVEGGKLGGTCVNTGCTPTKALVASAKVAHMVRRAGEYGIEVGKPVIDYGAVRDRMNSIRDNTGLEQWLEGVDNVTIVRGWGRFEGPRQLQVGDESITGDRVYINVGTRPSIPEIPGLDDVPWLDNGRLLDLEERPEHLVIVGGSYIGLEFGQIFRRFGSRVTIVERGPRLVTREDEDVSDAIRSILEDEGIEVLTDAETLGVAATGDGVTVSLRAAGEEREIAGSHLFLAVGRVPNADRIDVDAAGIEVSQRGYIVVDDHCRTTVEGVFAVGDVNGRGAFTHTSVNDAEIVLDLTRGGSRKLSDRVPVYGLFIDPALGRVGMTEAQAVAEGRNVLVGTRPMSRIGRAKEMGETKGFAKLIVDGDTDEFLGAAILGPGGDEIVNMIAAFMYSGQTWKAYRRSVLVHPTISELMPWILDTLSPA